MENFALKLGTPNSFITPESIEQWVPAIEEASHDTFVPTIEDLKEFCKLIGVPFPIEKNPRYQKWWRILHEIGHWAVKPNWYNEWYITLMDIPVTNEEYEVGNDIIPDVALLFDPTADEFAVRKWCLEVLKKMGWTHPLYIEKLNALDAQIWMISLEQTDEVEDLYVRWGLDVQNGVFRPANDGFSLPYPSTKILEKIILNHEYIMTVYAPEVVISTTEEQYWTKFLRHRFQEKIVRPVDANTPTAYQLADFAKLMGLPFLQETNYEYWTWWHLLHEVAHWAVCPDWFIRWGCIVMGIVISSNGVYLSGANLIPQIPILACALPGEYEVRVWCIEVMKAMGWTHPLDTGEIWKPVTVRIWMTTTSRPDLDKQIRDNLLLDKFGFDFQNENFRPVDDGFFLKYENPTNLDELKENLQQIAEKYPSFVLASQMQEEYWDRYLLYNFS